MGGRWVMRIAFAAPTALAAVLAEIGGVRSRKTPNDELLDRVSSISWSEGGVDWIGELFPPLTAGIAVLIGWTGPLGLAMVGAAIGGLLLQQMSQIMVQRRFRIALRIPLLAAVGLNPLFPYNATENLGAFLGIAFFGVGIANAARFLLWGHTRGGFTAGILFMLAVLSDRAAILYVLSALIAAPFLSESRRFGARARWANVVVLAYPSAAAIGSVVALHTIFLGSPVPPQVERAIIGAGGVPASVGISGTTEGYLLIATVILAWAASLVLRRPSGILVSSLIFVAVEVGLVIGLIPPNSVGNTYLLLVLMMIALVPTAKTRTTGVLLGVLGIVLNAVAWITAFANPISRDWLMAIVEGASQLVGGG
ncbi:hypothetical protein [Homoserinibacter sp. GY 40078]|uniref:hypothetical protein n=1 Tax=Homoserinibacter sp. GY 40078 TaxID=2603275 RepID=UPI0011C77C0D|nr:hypothetical protein [Homoserinibacter sp. GY 40078]TXK17513.1 hypothetical protein FVQ89_11890 [Homoserinibacter sp. GY 40078]